MRLTRPTRPVGPVVTKTIQLGGLNSSTGQSYVEQVDVQVWRAACSAGRSAVLVIEEGQPEFIEKDIATLLHRAGSATRVHGKDLLSMAGEYTVEVVARGLAQFVERHAGADAGRAGTAWLDTVSDLRRRAFYPLTMPLTVGPGSISVAIALGANQAHSVRSAIVIGLAHVTAVVVVALTIFLCYRYADRVLRRLGDTGTVVVTRLTAFILLCIGVQILWNGASTLMSRAPPV